MCSYVLNCLNAIYNRTLSNLSDQLDLRAIITKVDTKLALALAIIVSDI